MKPVQPTLENKTFERELLVFDLDGKVIQSNTNARMSTKLSFSINDAARRGLLISVATGRSWQHFANVVDKVLHSLSPCIISGGSQIVDMSNQTILWETQLTAEQIRRINVIAAKYDKLLSYNKMLDTFEPTHQIPSFNNVTIAYLLDIDSNELNKIHDEMSSVPGLYPAITQAWGETEKYALHITSVDANKGAALLQLIKILHTSADRAIAIGEGFNDAPMFEVAGTALSIKGSAVDGDEHTAGSIPGVNNDGLANYISRLYNKHK